MAVLSVEDGIVSLDGEELDGIVQYIKIDNKVRFDEAKVDGASGKKKTPQGFEDASISIDLLLLTDDNGTCYDKLGVLNGIFLGIDDTANPKIYTITNKHLLARGVREVVFSSLSSSENSRTDEISASLKFVEHNPPIIRLEESQAKSPTAKELEELALEENSSDDIYELVFTE